MLATATAQFKVALCGAVGTITACQWTDVQTRLQATGYFSAVDIIDVTTAGGNTPTLNTLLGYDALLCWRNLTPANNNTWGDVLADYVDASGGVVVAVFANSTLTAGRNISGRVPGRHDDLPTGAWPSASARLGPARRAPGSAFDPCDRQRRGVAQFCPEVSSILWSSGTAARAAGPNRPRAVAALMRSHSFWCRRVSAMAGIAGSPIAASASSAS